MPARGRKKTRAVRDPDGTRRLLLDSAVRLFERHGYHATSVQEIVAGAGLTKGAFYHHFETKEDVLHEVHDRFVDHQLELLRAVIDSGDPPAELMRRIMVEVLIEPVSRYRAEIAVFMQEYRFLSSGTFAAVRRKRAEFERLVTEVVEKGIAEGEFAPIAPPKLLAFAVIGVGAWACHWLDPLGPVTPRHVGEAFGALIVDGLGNGTLPVSERGGAFQPADAHQPVLNGRAQRERGHDGF
ncbi:TetR/AcrR family transcriptional regulator [Amycolatopsis sp. Poz14]|uniref:TetR/AcrR family transcriptional regulator n=1 Tax=Amycolatopsis sp. Poz14 TaxID=1447705 RepID=UPI001EE8A11C|nr:TetR/AcrR family transcriptional regulator [Amycolatopsis sp. Poz14]MCG3754062.1 TetR/AcrR family transcriptional regulator [Amycolatopsis sp. Poz14]